MAKENIQSSIELQQDQSDCGVACLLSVIKYYGGNSSIETIRKLSGTNITGTTLLGLYQAATSLVLRLRVVKQILLLYINILVQ